MTLLLIAIFAIGATVGVLLTQFACRTGKEVPWSKRQEWNEDGGI